MVRQLPLEVRQCIVQKYACAVKAISHIKLVCGLYPGLLPKTASVTVWDDTLKELVYLDGTIPVIFEGETYNIPINIWIPDTYPVRAPICYVAPTSSMRIEVSENITNCGRVCLTYLDNWDPVNCNLKRIVETLKAAFGENPPVSAIVPGPTPPADDHGQPNGVVRLPGDDLSCATDTFMFNRLRPADQAELHNTPDTDA